MAQAAQHPGNQQGLEPNPYYAPNVSLQQSNQRVTGEDQMRLAQAEQAGAMAGKAQAETEIMAGLGAMGQQVQAGAPATPQEVQAGQVSDAIIQGQIGEQELGQMIQNGEIDQATAEAAMGLA